MPELKRWEDLPVAGVVERDEALRPRTGSYRTGLRPELDRSQCVDCLLCWLYCPDAAFVLHGATLESIDLDVCKGCEICSVVCPEGAIAMVAE